jgi:TusA-related sulfurtransferase
MPIPWQCYWRYYNKTPHNPATGRVIGSEETKMSDVSTVEHLDITRESCPMTFVRTRLALDRLSPGSMLHVRLRGEEPLRNVAGNVVSLGHALLETRPLDDGSVVLEIRRR